MELTISGFDLFPAQVTDVEVKYFIVQEHVQGYLIARFVFVEIDVTRIINGADHILYAFSDIVNARSAYRGASL